MAEVDFTRGFPGDASKEPTCQCRRHKRLGLDSWVVKIPWRRTWQPTPVFLTGHYHAQRSLAGYSPWGSQRVGHYGSNLARRQTSESIVCDSIARAVNSKETGDITGGASKNRNASGLDGAKRT